MKTQGAIRMNIETLLPWADEIEKCRSFEDLFKMFYGTNSTRDLQTAIGENFADEYCIQYAPQAGFTDFRPATGKEDWEEGTDAVGLTHRHVEHGDAPARALRQDKAYDPFNPKAVLDLKDLAGLMTPMARGDVDGRNIMIFTTLPHHRLSLNVQRAFSWIVSRDHYESELKDNARFFIDFASRIRAESLELESRRRSNLDGGEYTMMKHQNAAIRHAAKHKRSFICLPPGSGKTEVQARIAKKWLKEHPVTVYIAPTLALLDQNFYKVAKHCHGSYKKVILACSAKDFSVYDVEQGFLKKNQIVFGSISSEEVQHELVMPGRKLVGTTYKSYPRLVEFFKKNNLQFDRIADEALEVVPSRGTGHADNAKDIKEQENLWNVFADNDPVRKSACFDAFEKTAEGSEFASDIRVGTDHPEVFGAKFKKTFSDMIKAGTIVPTRIRAVMINATDIEKMDDYKQPGWTREDKINFTALCHVIDHVIHDKTILNKKIVAFMHRARVCPRFVEPLRNYLKGKMMEYVDAIVADTDNRNRILERYKEADHAIITNFGVLGRGFDNSDTTACYIGRSMVSTYGMHGIHRPCRSHPDEFALPAMEHVKKPCGYVYVAVVEDDLASKEQLLDLEGMLGKLYDVTGKWHDDVEVVTVVHRNEKDDDEIGRPMPEFLVKPIEAVKPLYDRIKIYERDFMKQEKEKASEDINKRMKKYTDGLNKSYMKSRKKEKKMTK